MLHIRSPRWFRIRQLSRLRWLFTRWRRLLNHLFLLSVISLMLLLSFILVSRKVIQVCSNLHVFLTSHNQPGSGLISLLAFYYYHHYCNYHHCYYYYHHYYLLWGLFGAVLRMTQFLLISAVAQFYFTMITFHWKKKDMHSCQFWKHYFDTIYNISFVFQQNMRNCDDRFFAH